MNTLTQIQAYISNQPESKRIDMEALHQCMLQWLPMCTLWFLDGMDETGKTVSNPNIGYGQQTMKYADGRTREFYQIGLSSNKTGISLYIMGINDNTCLPMKYGNKIGKASVTGYCIKFRTLKDIDLDILEAAIRDGIAQTS